MFFQLISRVVCTSLGFVYPAYASFKAIKSNDLAKLEVWLMYWVVMGTVMAAESTVEWFFAWFPFYYELKTIVIVGLTLPHIQGSTYVYINFIHPFLEAHEDDIDAALADAKVKAKQVGLDYLNRGIQKLKQAVLGTLAQPQLFEEIPFDPTGVVPVQTRPPTLADPASGATAQLYSLAGNLVRTYGPVALAAGSALMHPIETRNNRQLQQDVTSPTSIISPTSANSNSQPRNSDRNYQPADINPPAPEDYIRSRTVSLNQPGTSNSNQAQAARQRRAELEAQLAALPPSSSDYSSSGDSTASSSSTNSFIPIPMPKQSRIFHPRSVSAGQPSTLSTSTAQNRVGGGSNFSRSATMGTNELNFGFEEIKKEDYPPVVAAAMQAPGTSPGGTPKKANWWWGNQDSSSNSPSGGEGKKKKDQ